ncbi:MAG: choice-of-anchor tandem repeat GloVer-containing protein, partial [Bacteroidota bacterium]
SMLKATDGNLYGLTTSGGVNGLGVIFQYSISTNAYTKMFDLSTANGSSAPGDIVQSSANGKLYGLTRLGGINNQGVIFEYDYTTSTYTKKFDLASTNTLIGGAPFCSPIFGSNGKLYGPLTVGGLASGGVIFEFDVTTSTYVKKIDFNFAPLGGNAYGAMVYAANNKLYGTTVLGGANNAGVIFEYDKTSSTYTKKFDMLAATGSAPYGAMIEAANSKLYGMSNLGGANSLGTIYEYNYSTNSYTKKIDLASATGSNPFGRLLQASNGKLYGLTKTGGANGLGVLFEYDYSTNTYTDKIDFAGTTNGQNPSGSLIEAPNGKLYGLTELGGANNLGVVFEYNPSTGVLTNKYDLNATSGSQPMGSFALANDGNLYAITKLGGTNSIGTLIQYDFTNNVLTKKLDLISSSGGSPNSSLIKAANGKLYAPYTIGGTNNQGTISEYDVTSATLTKLFDLSASTSYSPAYASLVEICPRPAAAGAIAVSTNSVCRSNSSTFNFSIATIPTASSYSWNLPSGASIVSGSLTNNIGVDFSGVAQGVFTYSVGGVNLCGMGTVAVANITIVPLPTVTVNNGTICSGNSFTMVPSGATSYSYSSGSAVVSPITNTTYVVSGASLGCVSTATSNVTVNLTPIISVNSGSICTGNSFTMLPSGASTYTYSSGSAIVSPLTNTSYTVTGTSALGCVGSNSAVSNVTVNITPTVAVNSGTLCTGLSFTMVPNGASTYTYSSGSAIVSPITNTSYSVTGTSAQGCVSTNTAVSNVTVYVSPFIASNSGSICSGQSFIILTAGASTYTYS